MTPATYEVGDVLLRGPGWEPSPVADRLDLTLVSADRQLQEAGPAESPATTVARLKLARP